MKFSAWPGFEVPDLTGAVDDLEVQPGGEDLLDATYYDTKELRLIRSGVTVRHRTATDESGWTVKFPQRTDGKGGDDRVLRRREVHIALPAGEVPPAVSSLVLALARAEVLEPVAHLQTRRRRFDLSIADRPAGRVDDDEVSVLDGDRIAARFREVEVELLGDSPRGLPDAVEVRLRAAGAGAADPTPKLVRALGPRALAPPDVPPHRLGDDPSMGEVVQAAVVASVRRILEHDHVVRLDEDVEGVHQARVGTRRLRSDLRTFGPVVDESWSEPLRTELGWFADALGEVRDADVLRARLLLEIDELPRSDDRAAAGGLVARLDRQRRESFGRLVEVMGSPRYVDLLDRLVDAAHHPELTGDANRAASKVLPKLVERPWRKLVKAERQLERGGDPEGYHRVRIQVKRARYAAEVATPVIGSPARRLAEALADAQDVLGDHQDAAVAEEWLRRAAVAGTSAEALAAGEIVASERLRAAELRGRWPRAWSRVDDSRNTRWL
jgi:CHAD domain-containing protein